VAWKTENGTHQAGVVTFHRLDKAADLGEEDLGPRLAHRNSASTASCALRAAISTGSHTGENGGA
jgi:hypothetical protein